MWSIVRIIFSFLLGLNTFVVLDLASEYLVPREQRDTPLPWLVAALYLALAQFLLAPKGKGFNATKPTLAAMVAPVVVMFVLAGAIEKHANTAEQTVWWFLIFGAGVLGAVGASFCGKRVPHQEEVIRMNLEQPK